MTRTTSERGSTTHMPTLSIQSMTPLLYIFDMPTSIKSYC